MALSCPAGAGMTRRDTAAPPHPWSVRVAVEQIPETLLGQLAEGGRLVAVLKDGQSRAWLYVKENGKVGRRPDFDADVPVLAGFKKAIGFIF